MIEAIKELAPGRIDREIAQLLNQRGLVTGTGRPFTQASVNWIRWKEGIANPASPHLTGIGADGRYSTSALAEKLGVGIHTIHYWRQKGILQATQEYARGPWWHQVTPEILTTLRQKIRRVASLPE